MTDTGPRYTRQLQVRLDDEQFDALKSLAQGEGIAMSHAVRLVLSWALLPDENRQLELTLEEADMGVQPARPAELLHDLRVREGQ